MTQPKDQPVDEWTSFTSPVDSILNDFLKDLRYEFRVSQNESNKAWSKARKSLQAECNRARIEALYNQRMEKVDRFEVIEDTGRVYVKGSIYGSPVSVELSYQDDGRTLKVFVRTRAGINKKEDGDE